MYTICKGKHKTDTSIGANKTHPKNPINPPPRRPGRKRKRALISLSAGIGPTAERIRHVRIEGATLVVETYRTDQGGETQLKRWRLISPLEQLWKAGVIDAGQYGAARRYQRDADIVASVGNVLSVNYEPRMIDNDGQRFLLPMEKATEHLIRMALAERACGAKHFEMLAWIALEPRSWRDQARAWWPEASETWARVSFKRLFRQCCSSLEAFYKRA